MFNKLDDKLIDKCKISWHWQI